VNAEVFGRSLVLALMLYFGWTGVLVIVVPVVSYLKTQQMGASPFQATFLAATSCSFFSWLMLLAGVEVQPIR
jgi:hypothetical protein